MRLIFQAQHSDKRTNTMQYMVVRDVQSEPLSTLHGMVYMHVTVVM